MPRLLEPWVAWTSPSTAAPVGAASSRVDLGSKQSTRRTEWDSTRNRITFATTRTACTDTKRKRIEETQKRDDL
jgi:hypothetical protein